MIVTIDGPAGAGKSTAAKALAARLGFEVLDTGAMYRAVTLAAVRAGARLDDPAALETLLMPLALDLPPGRVLLDGEDVSALIRTPEITAASGPIASNPAVRRRLVQLQRQAAAGRNMVCEGRDQGTVVFPDALCKFFLVAEPCARAERRWREMQARGQESNCDDVLRDQQERDGRDAARDLAPMKPADDALVLDSTGLSLDEVVARMEREVRARLNNNPEGRNDKR